MATTDTRFAAKTSSLAPLTGQADAFADRRFAKPSFTLGRLVVAKFEFPKSRAISEVGPSYTAGDQAQMPPQEQDNGSA